MIALDEYKQQMQKEKSKNDYNLAYSTPSNWFIHYY